MCALTGANSSDVKAKSTLPGSALGSNLTVEEMKHDEGQNCKLGVERMWAQEIRERVWHSGSPILSLTESLWVLKLREEEKCDFFTFYKYSAGSSKKMFSQLFVE